MIPQTFDVVNRHESSVHVGYDGKSVRLSVAQDPNAAEYFGSDSATHVDADSFLAAVERSVQRAKLFGRAGGPTEADYWLVPLVVSEEEPQPGLRMKSTISVRWRLVRRVDQSIVYQELIETTGWATPGSVVGVRTAVEGAVRENISALIKGLSRLEL